MTKTSVRPYYLLTGATGLLGRYILRNLLLKDVPVAVVVRGTRLASARARVDSLMLEIEEKLGRSLPRPVVLTGELTEPDLGLSAEALAWAGRHVGAILHNAASLTFQTADRTEEPWLSNVTGTKYVLDLARRLNVREFHHVSTAYVCGQRRGRVLETELNLGQAFGNDYEASKLEAESLVHAANWLDTPTIYRPAIIVGDSQTGFTNTFHGFYTPLQIAHSMFNKVAIAEVDPQGFVEILGLAGHERKNLVPVDWVGAVIAHLAADPQHHGLTYHLTPRESTSVALLCDVMDEAISKHFGDQRRATDAIVPASGQSFAAFQAMFRSQMTVYQAYWRDDPQFDQTNTLAHAPHLPCPALDRATLLKLCQFAIENKFWWSRGQEKTPPLDIESLLSRSVRRATTAAEHSIVNLHVSGWGGGDWRLAFDSDRLSGVTPGVDIHNHCHVHTSAEALQAIATGELSLTQAMLGGLVTASRCLLDGTSLRELLAPIFERNNAATSA
jgi:thioester reductase-like protein